MIARRRKIKAEVCINYTKSNCLLFNVIIIIKILIIIINADNVGGPCRPHSSYVS